MPLAQELARLLERDPIATGQIKEHLAAERLFELLGVEQEIRNIVEDERELSDFDKDEILEYVVNKFTKAEILAAISDAA
jgi:hypothetical protein